MLKYFGTDDISDVAGEFITEISAYKKRRCIRQYCKEHNNILISRDNKISSEDLVESVGIGFAASGSYVYNIGFQSTLVEEMQ